MKQIITVQFKKSGKSYFFDPGSLDVKTGDYVIVETARGTECGEVSQGVHNVPDSTVPKPLKGVVRVADDADVRKMRKNREDERKAFTLCEERIEKHNLPMKLIDVEYAYSRNKILFYFTADSRVDFRELVKDLAGTFHTRIELRQIGVRDETKMIGGLGICGQPFCCSRFLKNFQPVSIKMAKEQGLSLNPTKISGSCGRLMCCLAYEQPAYEHLGSITPTLTSLVDTPDGQGIVTEVNLISGQLRVRLQNGTEMLQKYFHRDECTYISGGKKGPGQKKGGKGGKPKADEAKADDKQAKADKPKKEGGRGGRGKGSGKKQQQPDKPQAEA